MRESSHIGIKLITRLEQLPRKRDTGQVRESSHIGIKLITRLEQLPRKRGTGQVRESSHVEKPRKTAFTHVYPEQVPEVIQ